MEETITSVIIAFRPETVADFVSLMDKSRPIVVSQASVTLPEEAAWDVMYKQLTEAMEVEHG